MDFVSGVEKLYGKIDFPKGTYNIPKLLKVEEKTFWYRIENTPNFWLDLDPYDWMWDLYKLCREHVAPDGDVVFASAPTLDPECTEQKIRWLHKYFGRDFRHYVITPQKHLMATSQTILIDDSEQNCLNFEAFGGRSILFSQPWNDKSWSPDQTKLWHVNHILSYWSPR